MTRSQGSEERASSAINLHPDLWERRVQDVRDGMDPTHTIRFALIHVFATDEQVSVFGSPLNTYLHDAEFYNRVNLAERMVQQTWDALGNGRKNTPS